MSTTSATDTMKVEWEKHSSSLPGNQRDPVPMSERVFADRFAYKTDQDTKLAKQIKKSHMTSSFIGASTSNHSRLDGGTQVKSSPHSRGATPINPFYTVKYHRWSDARRSTDPYPKIYTESPKKMMRKFDLENNTFQGSSIS